MLGFTLSKMNLLIFVFAIFIILGYFLASLTNIVIAQNAQQIATQYGDLAYGKVKSNTLCDRSDSVRIPREINIFGSAGGNSGQNYFYVMAFSQNTKGKQNTLIVSVAPRKKPDNILASASFDSATEFKFYSLNVNDLTLADKDSAGNFLNKTVLDPQASIPVDSVSLVKEVFEGKTIMHVIPCSSTLAICASAMGQVGCILCQERGGNRDSNTSKCIPAADDCGNYGFTCG